MPSRVLRRCLPVLAITVLATACGSGAVGVTGADAERTSGTTATGPTLGITPVAVSPSFIDLPEGWSSPPGEPGPPPPPGEATDRQATALNWEYAPTDMGWARPGVFVGTRTAVTATVLCPSSADAIARLSGDATLPLPVELSEPTTVGELPGVPGTVEYRFAPRAQGFSMDLRVSFATTEPTPAMLASAQQVVDNGLRVPLGLSCP